MHALNQLNEKHPELLHVIKNCNILLDTDAEKINHTQFDMFAIHIPYPRTEIGNEVELIHNLHMLTIRCGLSRIFFCYETSKELQIILTVCI